jgi:hypothetical protein
MKTEKFQLCDNNLVCAGEFQSLRGAAHPRSLEGTFFEIYINMLLLLTIFKKFLTFIFNNLHCDTF